MMAHEPLPRWTWEAANLHCWSAVFWDVGALCISQRPAQEGNLQEVTYSDVRPFRTRHGGQRVSAADERLLIGE